MTEWKPIETPPKTPMAVLFFYGGLTSYVWPPTGEVVSYAPDEQEPYREERCKVGFWDGDCWCQNGTGHDACEDEDKQFGPLTGNRSPSHR